MPKKERGSITSFPWEATYFSGLPTSRHFWGKIVKHCSKFENGFFYFETKALVNKSFGKQTEASFEYAEELISVRGKR